MAGINISTNQGGVSLNPAIYPSLGTGPLISFGGITWITVKCTDETAVPVGANFGAIQRVSDNEILSSWPVSPNYQRSLFGDELASVIACGVNGARLISLAEDPSGCQSDEDCPEGYKCVDGDCVECDQVQATHYRLRWEYPELTAFSGSATLGFYQLGDITPITDDVDVEHSANSDHNSSTHFVRIIFCNDVGEPRLYNGIFSIVSSGTTSSAGLGEFSGGGLRTQMIGPETACYSVWDGGFISQSVVSFVGESLVVYEEDCSGQVPEDIVEPEGGIPPSPLVEPEPPVIPDPVDPIVEPIPPVPPPPIPVPPAPPVPLPEPVCECEKYLGEILLQVVAGLYDIIAFFGELFENVIEALFSVIAYSVQVLENFIELGYQSVLYFGSYFQLLLETIVKFGNYVVSVYQQEKELDREMMRELFLSSQGVNIPDALKSIEDSNEPVVIENEYRVESRRSMGAFDDNI